MVEQFDMSHTRASSDQTAASEKVVVEFDPQEVVVLRNLLNVAVMARGMEVAEACLVLDRKLLAAGQAYEAARRFSNDVPEPALR